LYVLRIVATIVATIIVETLVCISSEGKNKVGKQRNNPFLHMLRNRLRTPAGILLLLTIVIIAIILTIVLSEKPHPLLTQPQSSSGSTYNSPYGFSVYNTGGVNSGLVTRYQQLKVWWVRIQVPWKDIETSQGVYNFSTLDQEVTIANQAKIHITFPIYDAPVWDRNVICPADGKAFLPNAQTVSNFASIVAKRYNGRSGHGYIDSYEIFNEEPTLYYDQSIGNASLQCRLASFYVPQLKAGYTAIKAQSPSALVGMLGYWYESISYEKQFMIDMYAQGAKPYFDFANFHFYTQGRDPSIGNGDTPSFDQRWQTMYNVMVANGASNK